MAFVLFLMLLPVPTGQALLQMQLQYLRPMFLMAFLLAPLFHVPILVLMLPPARGLSPLHSQRLRPSE
jgi:hypothetical protein